MGRKRKEEEKEFRVVCPESSRDIENVVEMLQEHEMSILLDMSKNKGISKKQIDNIVEFIELNQKSYMTLKANNILPKVIVCWSIRNRLL